MTTCRKDGRSSASCARGIDTSMYGTKGAKKVARELKLRSGVTLPPNLSGELGYFGTFLRVLCVFAAEILIGEIS
jgi:hypothetical protein